MKKTLLSILVGGLALLTTATTASAAYITASALNMRSGPSTSYSVIRVLTRGTWVDTLWCNSGWCKIIAQGQEGYASQKYISNTKPVYKKKWKKKRSRFHKHGRYSHSHSYGWKPHSHGGPYGWYPLKYYGKPGLYFHFRF